MKGPNVDILLTCNFLENVPSFILGSFMHPEDDKKLVLPSRCIDESPGTIEMDSRGIGVLVCT